MMYIDIENGSSEAIESFEDIISEHKGLEPSCRGMFLVNVMSWKRALAIILLD